MQAATRGRSCQPSLCTVSGHLNFETMLKCCVSHFNLVMTLVSFPTYFGVSRPRVFQGDTSSVFPSFSPLCSRLLPVITARLCTRPGLIRLPDRMLCTWHYRSEVQKLLCCYNSPFKYTTQYILVYLFELGYVRFKRSGTVNSFMTISKHFRTTFSCRFWLLYMQKLHFRSVRTEIFQNTSQRTFCF